MRNSRSGFSKKRLLIALLVFILAIISIDLFMLSNQRKPVFSMEPADAGIKLLGIEPDGSGIIFDVNGRKIRENAITSIQCHLFNKNFLARTYIFEVPVSSGIILSPWISARRSGERGANLLTTSWDSTAFLVDFNDRMIFYPNISIKKYEKIRHFFGFFTTNSKTTYIDIKLRYLGPKSKIKYKFSGPFIAGQTLATGDIEKCTLFNIEEVHILLEGYRLQL